MELEISKYKGKKSRILNVYRYNIVLRNVVIFCLNIFVAIIVYFSTVR
jgi:hypothetical protein